MITLNIPNEYFGTTDLWCFKNLDILTPKAGQSARPFTGGNVKGSQHWI